MPRLSKVALLLVVMLTVSVGALAQTPPPQPGPEHKKMAEVNVGDWTYEGQSYATPAGPAGKTSGKAIARPILGGWFVEFQGEDTGPSGTTQWREIDGWDPAEKKFRWYAFGSDGGVASVTYTIDGTTLTWSGTQNLKGKQQSIRGTIVFSPDFMSSVNKGELSVDGKTWMPSSESKWTKAKASPK